MTLFLSFEEIGEVLAASGEPVPARFLRLPQLDMTEVREARNDLATEILWAFTFRNITPELTSDAHSRRQYEELGKAVKAAKVIEETIGLKGTGLTPSGVDLVAWLEELRRIKDAATAERQRMRSAGLNRTAPLNHIEGHENLTPGEALVAGLAQAYEFAFEKPVRFTYSASREAEGGFVKFCQAVLRFAEQRSANSLIVVMSAEAIRKAWDRASDKLRQNSNACPVTAERMSDH